MLDLQCCLRNFYFPASAAWIYQLCELTCSGCDSISILTRCSEMLEFRRKACERVPTGLERCSNLGKPGWAPALTWMSSRQSKGGIYCDGDRERMWGTWICLFNRREKTQPEKVGMQTAQRWTAVLVRFTGLKLKCVISLKCYCGNVEGRTWDCSEIAK